MAKAKKPSKKSAKSKTTTAKPKRKSPPKTQARPRPIDQVLDVTNFRELEYPHMQKRIQAGEYVDADTLARALKMNHYDGIEMPREVLDYYHDFLIGKVKIPRGRKAAKKKRYSFEESNERMAVREYRQRLEQLLADRKQKGVIRRRTDNQKALHETAAIEAATWIVNNPLKSRNITAMYFIKNIVPKHPVTEEIAFI